jgi:hypothetical protein
METWKAVIGLEEIYEISDQGNIRRIYPFKSDGRKQSKGPTIYMDKKYPRVRLYKNGASRDCVVHRLVMAAFVGPLPIGHEVNHKNGVKTDNRLENLEYVTHSENQQHAYRVLLIPTRKGSKSPMAKVQEDDVLAMRALRRRGWQIRQIAREFGLSEPTVSQICNNKLWRHI